MSRWYRSIQSLLKRRLVSKSISISPPRPLNPKSMPRRVLTGFLKFGTYSALLTCAATAGVTYAYTVDEISDKTTRRIFPDRYTIEPIDIQTLDGKPIYPPTKDKKHSLPPLEFKSPFVARVVTGLGEIVLSYIKRRLSFQILAKECFAPRPDKLLPDTDRTDLYTLVLDLEETLVHSDWLADFDRGEHRFRPGFLAFLDSVHAYGYEVVLYTDVTKIDVMPLLCSSLQNRKGFNHVLTLGSIIFEGGHFRDLSRLNRDPAKILYVSAHALENCFQPDNCVKIKPWKKEETDDSALTDLIPFLEAVSQENPMDVRQSISFFNSKKDQLAQPIMKGTGCQDYCSLT